MPNQARQVGQQTRVGGISLVATEWDAEQHAYSGSDDCRLVLPLTRTLKQVDLMAASQQVLGNEAKPLPIAISTGYPGSGAAAGLLPVFDGLVDLIEADWNEDTYEVTGRSFAYLMMNAKITAVYQSKTVTDVGAAIAQAHGMTFNDGGKPSTLKAGSVYGQDHTLDWRLLREWDLLTSLAQSDNRELFVRGTTLYMVPALPDNRAPLATFTWKQNLLKLNVSHNAQFSHNITVEVRSYNPRSGQTTISSYDQSAAKSGALQGALGTGAPAATVAPRRRYRASSSAKVTAARVGEKEHYVYHVPGLSPEQCAAKAEYIWKDISRHEFILNVTVVGDPRYTVHDLYRINGTGTVVDQVYHAKLVRHSFSLAGGYVTDMLLVNHHVGSSGVVL